MSSVQKIIALIITLGLILIGIFGFGLYPKGDPQPIETVKTVSQDNSGVKVVSTNPDPLNDGVISPSQTLEITFNKPMVQDTTRIIIEPKVDYHFESSSDHKTIKLKPVQNFELGRDYTLTVKSGYDTDTGEKLDIDQVFHFKTIEYNGV